MKVVVYYRVSKRTPRLNIETQIQEIRPWLKEKGYEYIEFTEDGISGEEIRTRRVFREVLDALESGQFSCLALYAVDRIGRFRSRKDRYEVVNLVESKGILVDTLRDGSFDPEKEDDMNRLDELLLDAREENRRRSDAIRRGLKRSVKEGRIGGNPPYGLDRDGKGGYKINKAERQTLEEIVRLLRTDGTLKTIKVLNSDLKKYPTRMGGPWIEDTIHGFMQNDFYFTGKIQSKLGPVDTGVKPFFSEHVILEVRHEISKRRKRTGDGQPLDGFLLHGLVHCGECDSKLFIQEQPAGTGGRKKDYRYYRCRKARRGQCGLKTMRADWLDQEVWREFVAVLENPEELERTIINEELLPDKKREDLEALVNHSHDELERLTGEERRLNQLHIKGRISEQQHQEEQDRIIREREEAKDTFRKAEQTLNRPTEITEAVRQASIGVAHAVKAIRKGGLGRIRRKHPGTDPAQVRQRIFDLKQATLRKYIAAGGRIIIHQRPEFKIEINGIINLFPNHVGGR